jgi:hypothetical protein
MKHLHTFSQHINESETLPPDVKEHTREEYKRFIANKPNGDLSGGDIDFLNNIVDVTPLKYYPYANTYRYELYDWGLYRRPERGTPGEYMLCKDYKTTGGRSHVLPAAIFGRFGDGSYSLVTYPESGDVKYYTSTSLDPLMPFFASHIHSVILKRFKWRKIR